MDYILIEKYLSGNALEIEVQEIFKWIESSPENKATFIQYKKIWSISANHPSDHKLALQKIQRNISQNKSKKRKFLLLKYAAVFIGLFIISAMSYYQIGDQVKTSQPIRNQVTLELEDGSVKIIQNDKDFNILAENGDLVGQKEDSKLVYSNTSKKEQIKQLRYNVLKVPYGKRFEIELSDGSYVHLNAGSSLKYPVEFLRGKSRKVFLNGEAYFKVAKNKEDSFIVNANGLNTQVFGTEFNVSSYENDETTKIVLVEGSIGVYTNQDEFNPDIDQYLKPNEMASYSKAKKTIKIKEVDISCHISWIDGVLFFKNEPFNNIVNKLERHYDVHITNNYHDLNQQRFTGMFRIENIEEVLKTFIHSTKFNYKITEDQIIINP